MPTAPPSRAAHELFDVRRAHTWTAALSRWVDGQPELMLYRGQCLIHRAEMLYLRGDWDAAADQIEQAYRRLADPVGQRSRGAAAYLKGDLHRLRGQDRAAEAEFRLASELGRDPQPGLALLRLATGKVEAAAAAIRRAYREAGDPHVPRATGRRLRRDHPRRRRCRLRASLRPTSLARVAGALGRPLPTALHLQVLGAVLLAEDQPEDAISALRQALAGWRELDAAYEAARTRMLIAAACRAVGDDDSAELELAGAIAVFDRLNAVRDAAAARAALQVAAPPSSGLTSSRGRSPGPHRQGAHQPSDRRASRRQREDRGNPRRPHPHEAGTAQPCRRHRLRVRTRPAVTGLQAQRATVVSAALGSLEDARICRESGRPLDAY